MNTILCVKWGDKYDDDYVIHLKSQIDQNCSIPYNFYCLTDKPKYEFDIQLPTDWDNMYNPDTNMFWAYRKCYMFNEKLFPQIQGDRFLYLDLDILIHSELDYFFDLAMDKPYIVRGWWNDIENCRKNFGQIKSTPINSSVILWNVGQMRKIYNHINKNKEVIFFTYPTIDNYLNHFWYDIWEENEGFLQGFPEGDVYSWYKGNIFGKDMERKILRPEHKICLFNNSTTDDGDVNEIKELW
jgi:lipopolysaccharide biosynthesis glycosyltransferase